jgi:hypothetical protein
MDYRIPTGSSIVAAAEVLPDFVWRKSGSMWIPIDAAMLSFCGTSVGISASVGGPYIKL